MASLLTISEVAERTGLTVHTLRYYERAGLIAPVARAQGGQRRYAAADLDWIGFLLRLRETRMPIGQMQAFARLRSEGKGTAAQRRGMLERHLAEVLASIDTMRRAAKALRAKIGHYRALEKELEVSLRRAPRSTALSSKGKPHASRSQLPSLPQSRSALPPRPGQAAGDRRRSR